ncbi:tryptophan dimethylallyltransferase family protein [Streptomyces sp. NPDC088766]|uniref:tryptophan dimethylallyltransferase family protein n=1 Tax=Streptomyces sp. NPDC088766 TaxID=3365893 RepID=UPI00380135EB
MTATRPGAPGPVGTDTLGGHTSRQLLGLCEVVGLTAHDAEVYARTLTAMLGAAAERPLDLPPPNPTFLSDDHTPVEFSLSFVPGAAPALRVLLEPGCAAGDLARNGRLGLRAVREAAARWGVATDRLDELEDLFLPPSPEGPFALWCALELRPGGVPKVKVYLNPAATGRGHAAATVREALRRLGHHDAFAALPPHDRHLFFALDLGDWAEPRVKVYLAHQDLSAAEAGALSRTGGPSSTGGLARAGENEEFFRIAAGQDGAEDGGAEPAPAPAVRRPVQSCHAFTESASGLPSGFTLYVPVRDYAPHDGEALTRATALLGRHGQDPAPLLAAVSALTDRDPQEGVGLVAYLALAHQQGQPPRVTTYLSSEAYAVRPPVGLLPAQPATVR